MKIVVTGATGFVGSEVLSQLLKHPKVTSVVALSRRPLPESAQKSPKLQTIIHSDFSVWPPSTLAGLEDVDACIWALGIALSDIETQRKVNLEYTMTACEAFAKQIAPVTVERSQRKFRFVYTSGVAAVRDQQKSLWFLGKLRRLRGQVENELVDLSQNQTHKSQVSTFIVRPAHIRKPQGIIPSLVGSIPYINTHYTISVDALAAVMIDLVVTEAENQKQTWENADLVAKGRQLLHGTG